MASVDVLDVLNGKVACPVCGCIEQKGSIRCSECGTFHSGIHLEERDAPPPGIVNEREVIDPTVYSLSGNHAIPEEEFQEVEEIAYWEGGSTDFTVEEDERPLSKVDPDELDIPKPEILSD